MNEPERQYDPEKSILSAKITRHLRGKGWRQSKKSKMWIDPRDLLEHAFSRAIAIQIERERRP